MDDFLKYSELISNSSIKLPNDLKLELYGLYKVGTAGKCLGQPPAFYDMIAKAKYEAWMKFDGLTQLEARKKYVERVKDLVKLTNTESNQYFGGEWVPSSQMEKPKVEPGENTIFDMAKKGLVAELDSVPNIQMKDQQGMNILHWAADREQLRVIQRFAPKFDLNHQDALGNTAMHYAAMVENAEIVEMLKSFGAATGLPNKDGLTVSDFLS